MVVANYEAFKPASKFSGQLKKIQLSSNNMGYGPCPEPEDEIEQHLTITENGRVWLSKYCYGELETKLTLISKETFTIPAEDADCIMRAVAAFFESDYSIPFVTDVGAWDITLVNSDGNKFKESGPLCYDLQIAGGGLSDLIREKLGRNDLFAFDGNPDGLTRVEVKYHRGTKIKPAQPLPGASYEYVTWDYNEKLVLDRKTETLEHVREIGSGCKITRTYQVEGGISSFLDDYDVEILSSFGEKPEDIVDNPMETKDYEITIYTKHSDIRTISGTYDLYGLPEDWADFVEGVFDFISFYGYGEIFDSKNYLHPKRRKTDLIFCKVEFQEGGRKYTYLADTDDYEAGDQVIVPAGPDNRESVVRIASIEYLQPEDAPFPVEKTKHILRKYDKDSIQGSEVPKGMKRVPPEEYIFKCLDSQKDFEDWMSCRSNTVGSAESFLYEYDESKLQEGERLNLILCPIKWEVENNCLTEWLSDELYLYFEQYVNGELDDVIDPQEREDVVRILTKCFNIAFPEGLLK